jgi:hypothetical protein
VLWAYLIQPRKNKIKVSVNWLNSSMRNQNKVIMIGLIHSSIKQQSKSEGVTS